MATWIIIFPSVHPLIHPSTQLAPNGLLRLLTEYYIGPLEVSADQSPQVLLEPKSTRTFHSAGSGPRHEAFPGAAYPNLVPISSLPRINEPFSETLLLGIKLAFHSGTLKGVTATMCTP